MTADQHEEAYGALDSCLQGEYARSIVTWANKVCGVVGWGGREYASLFDLWYHHPAPFKHQPPLMAGEQEEATVQRSTALVLSCLHMALLHPESLILVLSPSIRRQRTLEQLVLLYLERGGCRPWARTCMAEPDGVRITCSNASTIMFRTLDGPDDLARLRGQRVDALLIEDCAPFLTYRVLTISLLPLLIGRTHPQTGSSSLGQCWIFSSSSPFSS